MARAVILGAGGHARVIGALAAGVPELDVLGILDRTSDSLGERIAGFEVIGSFADLPELRARGIDCALLAIGDNAQRRALHRTGTGLGLSFPVLRHASSVVEPSAVLEPGVFVGAMAYIGVEARIGTGAIVNTGASVDHECRVGAFAALAPAVAVAGRADIGEGAFLGIGSKIAERIRIGARARIGAGAVVLSDIPADTLAVGAPARPPART